MHLAFGSGILYSYAKTQQRAAQSAASKAFEPLEEVDIVDEEDDATLTGRVDSRLWADSSRSMPKHE
jgi:hypothetical protein